MRPVRSRATGPVARGCTAHLVPLPQAGTQLHSHWQQLAESAVEPIPFHEPAFVLAAARHLEGGATVRLLFATDGHSMIFALPVRARPGYRHVPLPVLTTWRHDYCFLAGPLLRGGMAEHAWAAVLDLALTSWHWLILEDIAAEGTGWDGLQAALRSRGVVPTERGRHERAVARRRDQPTYLDGRVRGVHLKGFRRQRQLLGADVRLRVRTGDAGAVEDFLDLEASGWKGRAGGAMAVRPGHAQLLREIVRDAPGMCEVFSLEAGGSPAAMQVNLRSGSVSYCFKTAYDESRQRQSPGLLLMLDVLRCFHDDSSLAILDSCAVAGHPMAERLLPDRRPLVTLLVPTSGYGRAVTRGMSATVRVKSFVSHTREPS